MRCVKLQRRKNDMQLQLGEVQMCLCATPTDVTTAFCFGLWLATLFFHQTDSWLYIDICHHPSSTVDLQGAAFNVHTFWGLYESKVFFSEDVFLSRATWLYTCCVTKFSQYWWVDISAFFPPCRNLKCMWKQGDRNTFQGWRHTFSSSRGSCT